MTQTSSHSLTLDVSHGGLDMTPNHPGGIGFNSSGHVTMGLGSGMSMDLTNGHVGFSVGGITFGQ